MGVLSTNKCRGSLTSSSPHGLYRRMRTIDLACKEVAVRRHGVISREQATRLGMTNKQIRRRVLGGQWLELFPGAYFIGGTTPTWESRLCAALACAGEGAVIAARSAAALLRLDGCRKGPVEVVTTRARTRLPFRCHRTTYLPAHHVRTKDGIRVTNGARTVFDLGGVIAKAPFERAATDALRKRVASLGQLRAVMDQLGARGRRGTTALKDFLQMYDPRLALTARLRGHVVPHPHEGAHAPTAAARTGLRSPRSHRAR
jgi:hypothetical protein